MASRAPRRLGPEYYPGVGVLAGVEPFAGAFRNPFTRAWSAHPRTGPPGMEGREAIKQDGPDSRGNGESVRAIPADGGRGLSPRVGP